MYIPKPNKLDDKTDIFDLMESSSFATVVTIDDVGLPFATHVPVVLDRTHGPNGMLISHIARANPQWKHFSNGQEILVIFSGPHAYVSPSWYASNYNVPTWNYMAVHAYGRPKIVENQIRLQQMLTALVATYEQNLSPEWKVDWSDERNQNMMQAIIGFEIEITQLEGKSKLSQNKSVADQQGVVDALRQSPDTAVTQVAEEMAKNLSS